jgi:hypothetical protein
LSRSTAAEEKHLRHSKELIDALRRCIAEIEV